MDTENSKVMISMTCLACNVGFEDVDLGRLHYKTDWHRYNLKRKVAHLAPVTLEQFQERQQLNEKQKQQNASQEMIFCKPCNKTFNTSNAYDNHVLSKKHKDVISGSKPMKGKKRGHQLVKSNTSHSAKSAGASSKDELVESMNEDDSDAESWDSYDENTLGIEECLFCSFISSSLEENLKHMTTQHSFFLPDAEFISDLEGLITYLGEKVGAGHVCLWCNEKGRKFYSSKDVQRHMVDKGHCKLLHEGDDVLEYADFYDYTSSYPNNDEPEGDFDEVLNPTELESDGFTLTLPSGATVGHRSLMRYYQQNLVPHIHDPTKKLLPKMLTHYKALGWTGSTDLRVEQRVKDLRFMQRQRKLFYTQLGCKANNLRHRFRDPNGPRIG